MKRRTLALALGLALLLCSCGKQPDQEPPEEPSPVETGYSATGWNNPDVPKYELDQEAFLSLGGFTIYTAANAASHIGIDVSTFQGEIDWAQVKEAGVEFAMLRAGFRGYGEGGIIREDSHFIQNIQGALGAGLDVGVYFFSQAISEEEAREEAQSVLNWLSPYKITYPVVFDWEPVEDPAARTRDLDAETVAACAKAFCDVVEEAGHTAMIYFNRNQGYSVYDLAELGGYEFWLAGYTAIPDFTYAFQMWQYSNTGTVPGIDGPVDLNLCLVDYPEGSKAAMAAAAVPESSEPPDGRSFS